MLLLVYCLRCQVNRENLHVSSSKATKSQLVCSCGASFVNTSSISSIDSLLISTSVNTRRVSFFFLSSVLSLFVLRRFEAGNAVSSSDKTSERKSSHENMNYAKPRYTYKHPHQNLRNHSLKDLLLCRLIGSRLQLRANRYFLLPCPMHFYHLGHQGTLEVCQSRLVFNFLRYDVLE